MSQFFRSYVVLLVDYLIIWAYNNRNNADIGVFYMLIEKKIANEILEKYGKDCVDLFNNADNFLTAEYNAIIETLRSQSMIVNPEMLRETQTVTNLEELQKKVAETLLLNLYTRNYIDKGEYEALCRQSKQ